MQLNNLLQQTYGIGALSYAPHQDGPQHNAPWVVVAYSKPLFHTYGTPSNIDSVEVRGIEYGRGVAHTQAEAKEQAASQAYRGVMAELNRRR